MSDDSRAGPTPSPLDGDAARAILDGLLPGLPGVVYRRRNDRDWTMIGLTGGVSDLTGYAVSELAGDDAPPYGDLIHPDDRPRVRDEVELAVEAGRPFRIVYRIRTRSGEERWVLEQGRAVDHGEDPMLAGYIQDLAGPVARRLAESEESLERARRQTRRLALLQAVTAIVNEEQNLKVALRAAVPLVCRALDFAVGHVWSVDDGRAGSLRSSRIWHLSADVDGLKRFRDITEDPGWSPDRGLPGRILASGEVEWIPDVEAQTDFYRVDGSVATPVRSGLGVAVVSGDRPVAVLEFFSTEPMDPDAELQRLVEQVGVQLGRVWEREEAARERRTHEARFRQLAENIDAGFWISTPDREVLYVSRGFQTLTGYDVEAEDWRDYLGRIHPDDRDRMEALFSDPDRAPYEVEYRLTHPDRGVRWIRQKAFPIEDPAGEVYRIGGLAYDVTRVRSAQWRLERVLDSLAEGVVIADREGRVVYANRSADEFLPFERSDLLGRRYDDAGWDVADLDGTAIDPEELPLARALRTGEPVWNSLMWVHGQEKGESVILSVNAVPQLGPDGSVHEVVVSFADVTGRERMALDLRESEERFRQLAERIDSVFWITSPDKSRMEYVSPAYQEIWGRPPDELYDDAGAWLDHIHPDDRERVRAALPGQTEGKYDEEYRVVRPDGEVRWVWDRAFPIRDDEGRVYRVLGIAEDVTERRRAEEELRAAEEHFRALIENSADVIAILDRDLVTRYVSPSVREVLGYRPDEIVGTAGRIRVHPDDREHTLARLAELRDRPGEILVQTHRMIARDGSVRHVESRAHNLLDEPPVSGIVINLRDVTERKELETQLRQAQKMEAVGRLAGGIAHDFNNLLTVIRSQSDLLLLDLPEGSPLGPEVEVIRDASDRAAQLTSQLLAFSREQVLRPRFVDLSAVVSGMKDLLTRVLGEDVVIETDLAPDLPSVRVDPVQLEQVVINLAVNARDAMPSGGTLRLSTTVEELGPDDTATLPGLEPGTVVSLAVSDTGIGMDEQTRARVFEPFFSTKESREGTGLGLAVSYGIVKQSGGAIHAESEPGRGSTFTVRFPPVEGAPERPEEPEERTLQPVHESGTVLVVEDDPNVRRVVRRILERAGFDVRTAGDAETGLRMLDQDGGGVDLVLTDLVLPGMGGRELVDLVRERDLPVRVVVMSGYDEGSPGTRGDLPGDVAFIQKPFTPEGLVETIRAGFEG